MVTWRTICWVVLFALSPFVNAVNAQDAQPGSLRGVVYDKDFDVPLAAVTVAIVETGQRTLTTDQGNFVLNQVPQGKYTVVFSKEGYVRQVKADVLVQSGRLTDLDASLAGEFTEMDEFVVQDVLQLGAGSEASLLRQRFESPALLDSIGADLMSRAGAGDAASGLRLVAGASVQNGKYAVIRGLPDRYVSSQMNGIRLPTADEDKRAVELDQFPSAVIESIQVSKTFTPDQQGDASGGAVNVRLKGIPDETTLQVKAQVGANSRTMGRDDFLTFDAGSREIQYGALGSTWRGSYGENEGDAPIDYKGSISGGTRHVFENGVKVGGFASVFYERDSEHRRDGKDDSLWVDNPGEAMTPETSQGTPSDGDFKTSLFDVDQSSESKKWGGLATFGVESENHRVGLTYLYTRVDEDTATVATDTRGKAYFFPGYDPNDPDGPGNNGNDISAAPYLRTDTLEHNERTTQTIQLNGRHKLPFEGYGIGDTIVFGKPELSWSLSNSTAKLDQPDKRQFGALWRPAWLATPTTLIPAVWTPYKPSANFTIGNAQRIWKSIEEESDQYAVDLEFPFTQWSQSRGSLKLGVFHDKVDRRFDQDTFSNFGEAGISYQADFDQPWSAVFGQQSHPITASDNDVDYRGKQTVSAWYSMLDVPLNDRWSVNGGARFESTDISIRNLAESNATWYPPGATAAVDLNPGDADVAFDQSDALPAIGVAFKANDQLTFRGSYSETIARQTFKELTPILQSEFLGGPVFIGNPELQMSALKNYDLRVDYTPYEGGLVSASWFKKDIDDPIEYVQRLASFTFTTPVNYPKGTLEGYELEVRQSLGHLWKSLEGLSLGANGTFIDSEVLLPEDEAAEFASPLLQVPITSRDMTNAPDHLYNVFLTYDHEATNTQLALFYTIQGDTLLAGAGQALGNFVPSVYAKEYGTLNLSASKGFGEHVKLQFQVKNLTDPAIETVYRSEYIGDDVTKSSYKKGVEYTLGLTLSF